MNSVVVLDIYQKPKRGDWTGRQPELAGMGSAVTYHPILTCSNCGVCFGGHGQTRSQSWWLPSTLQI